MRHLVMGFMIGLALLVVAALAVGGDVPTRNEGYPMHIIATQPPVADDLHGGDGYMFDGTRFKGYVLPDENYVLCRTVDGVNCGLLPVGTVILVPAMADTL